MHQNPEEARPDAAAPADELEAVRLGDPAEARAWALMFGCSVAQLEAAVAARACPGNRASTMLLMPELSAYRLGQLLALYEHRTFVEGMLYGLNPFDEFGVEYGRTLAGPIVAALATGVALPSDTDSSTRGLVAHVRARTAAPV